MSAPRGSMQSVHYQLDQISETAQRVIAERDIFARALFAIANGGYFFADRPRQIANAALTEAARL
jgi:hypothetical protein